MALLLHEYPMTATGFDRLVGAPHRSWASTRGTSRPRHGANPRRHSVVQALRRALWRCAIALHLLGITALYRPLDLGLSHPGDCGCRVKTAHPWAGQA